MFDEGLFDGGEEGAGGQGEGTTVPLPRLGPGKGEALLGAGHADVEEALFFGDMGVLAGIEAVGEEALFAAGDEDEGEFEAFGGVQRHEGDFFGAGLVVVGGGVERQLVEESRQRDVRLRGMSN